MYDEVKRITAKRIGAVSKGPADLSTRVAEILTQPWDVREGQTVPSADLVKLSGGAVKLEATMLYADLADSTELAMEYDRRIAARVYKCFLACATQLIRAEGGYVRSFDGDRVMGVFVGSYKNTSAGKCALKINYAVQEIVQPKLLAQYEALRKGSYVLAHCVGIDTSEVLVVRGGVRDNNDLLWIGRAPNIAAKLSTMREGLYRTYITAAVHARLAAEAKYGGDGKEMWEKRHWAKLPDSAATVYRSSWWWKP